MWVVDLALKFWLLGALSAWKEVAIGKWVHRRSNFGAWCCVIAGIDVAGCLVKQKMERFREWLTLETEHPSPSGAGRSWSSSHEPWG